MRTPSNKPIPSPWPIAFFAHRGAWGGDIVQNTPNALREAVRLGAPGVEFDLYLYGGELRLAHDADEAAHNEAATLKQALDAIRTKARALGKDPPIVNLELKGPVQTDFLPTKRLWPWISPGTKEPRSKLRGMRSLFGSIGKKHKP